MPRARSRISTSRTATTPGQIRDALNYHMKPHPVVVLQAARSRTTGTPASPPTAEPIASASSTAAAARRCWPDASGTSPSRSTPPPCTKPPSRLLGRHDFTSFRAASCQAKSPIRTLDRLDVTRHGDIIEVVAEARSFLHHQVRNFVGTLKLVGEGRWPVERVTAALEAKDRAAAGPTAPPDGLTLIGVGYPDNPFERSGG